MAIKLIKDIVGGNSVFSELEGHLFSSALYNRLHNVLQNSCTYFVYPTNRTSRFSHSLGAMNVTTKLINYAFCNAEYKVISGYLIDGMGSLNKMLSDGDEILSASYCDKISVVIGNEYKGKILSFPDLNDGLKRVLGSAFIKHSSVYNELFDDHAFFNSYLVMHQAIRLYALLHDIGHFPYSHITEYAITQSYAAIGDYSHDNNELTKNFMRLMRILIKCTESDGLDEKYGDLVKIFDLRKSKKIELHEIFGKMISAVMMASIINNKIKEIEYLESIRGGNNLRDKYIELAAIYLFSKTLMEIFKGRTGKFSSLYQLIDNGSGLDVDKIDYVYRDSYASGIDSNFDTDRILKMYCLVDRVDSLGNMVGYQFVPSIQSLNDINELFLARFRVYKYIVGHHKVKRYDYILYTLIRFMLLKRLTDGVSDISDFDLSYVLKILIKLSGKIKDYISGKGAENQSISYEISQLSDSWLLTVLQNERKRLGQKKLAPIESSTSHSYNSEKVETNILMLLEEFFTASKKIRSLWKRDHEYNEFCLLLGSVIKDSIVEDVKAKYEIYFGENPPESGFPKMFYCDYMLTGDEKYLPMEKDNLITVIEGMDYDKIGKKIVLFLNRVNEDWAITLTDEYVASEKLVIFAGLGKTLKAPDGHQPLIDIKDKKIYSYGEVSSIAKFLNELKDDSTQFYVYSDQTDINGLKNEICYKIKDVLFNNLHN